MSNIQTNRMYDDEALSAFEKAMGEKLAQKRDEGRGGWYDPKRCKLKDLERLLLEHVEKYGSVDSGYIDPHQLVDIANLAMFLWWRVQTEPIDER